MRYLQLECMAIPLVGPTSSGKSTFLGVLIEELREKVGPELNLTLMPADDFTTNQWNMRFNGLRDGHELPAGNRAGNVMPLMFLVNVDGHRWPWGRHPDAREILLVIYDSAGEDADTEEQLADNQPYLRMASGVILFVDPTELPKAVPDLERKPTSQARMEADSIRVIELVTRHLRTVHRGSRVDLPTAVIISKADELARPILAGSPILHDRRQNLLDGNDREEVNHFAKGLLHRWSPGTVQLLQQQYTNAGHFALSALGGSPKNGQVPRGGALPYRVCDPMVWLFSQFGIFGRTRRS